MPRWQRAYLIVCAAIVGFTLTYFACDFGNWQRPLYDPWTREWRIGHKTAHDMVYFGLLAWGLAGALVVGGTTWLITGRIHRELTGRWNLLPAAWALTAFAFTGLYYTWNLWPF